MARRRHVFSFLIACALLPAAASGAEPGKVLVQGKRDPNEVVIKGVRDPSPWFRIESQHVIVYSDSDPDQVIQLVHNLERLDYVLRMYLKPFLVRQSDPPKLTLYFQDRLGWAPGLGDLPAEQVGIVYSSVSGTQVFTFNQGRMWKSDNASLLKDDGDFTLSTVLYLYSDNFLFRHTDIRAPEWFRQGFGFYFGGIRFTDDQMAVGRPTPATADALKALDYGDSHLFFLSYDEVLRTEFPRGGFRRITRSQRGTPAQLMWAEFQARSFNLVHYMLSSAENRDKMARYLELVHNGADGGAAFADVFGLSGAALNTTMWRYRRMDMKVVKVDFPELPAARIEFTRLSRIEGEFVLANAALKACPSPDEGRKLLQRVRAAAAGARAVDLAQVTLSRAQIDWGDPRDAIPYLTDAVQRHPYDEELHYLLGLAHLRLAATGAGDKRASLAAAQASLKQAALLAPGTPAISYALFHAGLMDPDAPPEQAMPLAIAAWRQGHDVVAFARAAALAYAWLGDDAGAYRAFNTLARNKIAPDGAAWAVQWLDRLDKGVVRDDLLTAMRSEPLAPQSFRLSFGDLR
jgi:hypothetical protein